MNSPSPRTMRYGLTVIASLALLAYAGSASAQTPNFFTAGDLVVSQINTAGVTSGNAASVTLDEFATSGTGQSPIVSLTLQSTTGTGSNPLTLTNQTGEGMLNLSSDGQYLTIAGYDTAAGTSKPYSSTTISRDVAVVNALGSVDTSTVLPQAYTGNNIRTAYTPGGTANSLSIYTGGSKPTVATVTNSGLLLSPDGATSSSQSAQITSTGAIRDISVANNELFYTQLSSTNEGVFVVALPASSPAAGTGPLYPSPTEILTLNSTPKSFATGDASSNGIYTTYNSATGSYNIYIADDGTKAAGGGLYEYTYSGGGTNSATAVSGGAFTADGGLTAVTGSALDPNDIFATTTSNQLVDFNLGTDAFTTLATAPTGDEFEGVAFAPAPEPSQVGMLALMGLGLGGLVLRAKKKQIVS